MTLRDSPASQFADQISRAIQGDSDALQGLFLDVRRDFNRHVSYLVAKEYQHRFSPDDVAQDAYAKVIKQIGTLQATDRSGFLGWMKQIAEHVYYDLLRKEGAKKRGGGKQRVWGERALGEFAMELIADWQACETDATPSQNVSRKEAIDVLKDGLANLPDDYQRAIHLHHFDGLTVEATAIQMERTEGSVRHVLRNAKKLLRDFMRGSTRWFTKHGV